MMVIDRHIPEISTLPAIERRKIMKPILEKKRRDRINKSLSELKSLILALTNKEESFGAKMEKADILEMTANYLKTLNFALRRRRYSTLNNNNEEEDHNTNNDHEENGGMTDIIFPPTFLTNTHETDLMVDDYNYNLQQHYQHNENSSGQLSVQARGQEASSDIMLITSRKASPDTTLSEYSSGCEGGGGSLNSTSSSSAYSSLHEGGDESPSYYMSNDGNPPCLSPLDHDNDDRRRYVIYEDAMTEENQLKKTALTKTTTPRRNNKRKQPKSASATAVNHLPIITVHVGETLVDDQPSTLSPYAFNEEDDYEEEYYDYHATAAPAGEIMSKLLAPPPATTYFFPSTSTFQNVSARAQKKLNKRQRLTKGHSLDTLKNRETENDQKEEFERKAAASSLLLLPYTTTTSQNQFLDATAQVADNTCPDNDVWRPW